MSATHRTKRVDIEARQFSGLMTIAEARDLAAWCGGNFDYDANPGQEHKTYYWSLAFPGAIAIPGDWIIRLSSGHFQKCTAGIFASIYEPIPTSIEGAPA